MRRLHDALHCAHWISVCNPSWTVYKHSDIHPASQLPPLRLFVKLCRIKTQRFMNVDSSNSPCVVRTFERHLGKKNPRHSINTDSIKKQKKKRKKKENRHLMSERAAFLPRLECVHLLSAGAGRREGPGAVPFVLIGRSRHYGRRLPSPAVPVQRLVGVATWRDCVPAADAVVGRG